MDKATPPVEKGTNRLLPLEGLRGSAAVIVVLFHALLIFYPSFVYGTDSRFALVRHLGIEEFLRGNLLSVFFSGTLAVAVFFVLSGFVLSVGFFEKGDATIIKKLAAKRYIRLMVPALVSVVIVWLVIALGLDGNKQLVAAATGSTWLANIWPATPNLYEAMTQGIRSIFTSGEVSYNPVLWTMRYEFIGSFIVFGTAILTRNLKNRWAVYAILAVGFFSTWYLAFLIGLVLADLYANKRFPFQTYNVTVVTLVLMAGLIMGGYPVLTSAGSMYAAMRIGWLSEEQNQIVYLTFAAAIILVSAMLLPALSRFFASRYISGLGRYTFSLYLTHMPVLFTVTVSLFLWLRTFLGYSGAAFISLVISIPVIAIVAIMFERAVDGPSIRTSGIFSNWLLGIPQKEGVTAYSGHVDASLVETVRRVRRGVRGFAAKMKIKR